ncbi:hypothetical protein SMC26_31340 [Actinomadura fulvescens]|uniref:SH3b domain-containing protein n=1 Tax=Actinomadura fulvescens TaxID=46160 RepID=A0ABN3PZ44_9ACTN
MRTSIRTGVALSISGLAMSGAALVTSSGAGAATTQAPAAKPAAASTQAAICRYTVEAKGGLYVRRTPGGRIVGRLRNGKIVFAKCQRPHGWVKLRGGVKRHLIGKWVYRPHLARY